MNDVDNDDDGDDDDTQTPNRISKSMNTLWVMVTPKKLIASFHFIVVVENDCVIMMAPAESRSFRDENRTPKIEPWKRDRER